MASDQWLSATLNALVVKGGSLMSLVIPTKKEIKALTDVLKEIRDIEKDRLQVERGMLNVMKYGMPAIKFKFNAVVENQPLQENIIMLQLTDVQKCDLSVQPIDAKGNAAPVQDGSGVWTVSDPTVLSVTASADGLTATIVALGPLGASQVNFTADADLGDGVTTITGTLDVTVVASQATSVTINTGAPVAQ